MSDRFGHVLPIEPSLYIPFYYDFVECWVSTLYRAKRYSHTSFLASAMLVHLLTQTGVCPTAVVQQGYFVMSDTYFRHYWVVVPDKPPLDIRTIIGNAMAYEANVSFLRGSLVTDEPTDLPCSPSLRHTDDDDYALYLCEGFAPFLSRLSPSLQAFCQGWLIVGARIASMMHSQS